MGREDDSGEASGNQNNKHAEVGDGATWQADDHTRWTKNTDGDRWVWSMDNRAQYDYGRHVERDETMPASRGEICGSSCAGHPALSSTMSWAWPWLFCCAWQLGSTVQSYTCTCKSWYELTAVDTSMEIQEVDSGKIGQQQRYFVQRRRCCFPLSRQPRT